MGYSEENGAVVLTMTPADYNTLLMALGYASVSTVPNFRISVLGVINRINAGNPQFTPYEIEGAS